MSHQPIITCCLCSRVAWYKVGMRGFCGQHYSEAQAAARKENEVHARREAFNDFRGKGK